MKSTKKNRVKVEPGIWRVEGRYMVRTPKQTGSTSTVESFHESLADARAWQATAAAIRARGGVVSKPTAASVVPATAEVEPTFGEMAERWFTARHRQAELAGPEAFGVGGIARVETVLDQRSYLNRMLKPLVDMPITTVDREVIQDLVLDWAEQGYAKSSQVSAKGIIRAVLDFAPDRWALVRNPTKQVRVFEPQNPMKPRATDSRVLTLTEIQRWARNAHTRMGMLIYLGGIMGLRISESFGVEVRDIDWIAGTLSIERQRKVLPGGGVAILPYLKTKSGKRVLHAPQLLLDYMDWYIREFHGDPFDPALAHTPLLAGQRIKADGTRNVILASNTTKQMRVACDKAGLTIDKIGFSPTTHDLRRSFGGRLGAVAGPETGITGAMISAYLGHKRMLAHEEPDPQDRAAHVTASKYMPRYTGPWMKPIADALDKMLADEGITLIPEPFEGVTVDYAIKRLSLSQPQISHMLQVGQLRGVRIRVPGEGPRWSIDPASVEEAYAERYERAPEGWISPQLAAEQLGISAEAVRYAVHHGHLESVSVATRHTHTRIFISPESVAAEAERRRTPDGLTIREAAVRLRLTTNEVRNRIRNGTLPAVLHPEHMPTGVYYIDRDAIEAEAHRRGLPESGDPRWN